MTAFVDYPDYRKSVATRFTSTVIWQAFSGTESAIGSQGLDVSQLSAIIVSFGTTGDAAGKLWTVFVQWSDAAGHVLFLDTYSFLGSADVSGTSGGGALTLPVRGASVTVSIAPTDAGGNANAYVFGTDRPLPFRIRGGAFNGSDLGLNLAAQNLAAGATAAFPIGTTSDLIDLRSLTAVSAVSFALDAWAAGSQAPGWVPVFAAAQTGNTAAFSGLVVPPQALRLRFLNSDTAVRGVGAQVWTGR